MLNMRDMKEKDFRRRYVLDKLGKAGAKGYQASGDEPGWWRETLLELNDDELAYPQTKSGAAGFTWFISDKGKAVRK